MATEYKSYGEKCYREGYEDGRKEAEAQLTAERAKVEEAERALESAKYELRNYTKDSMGYKNSTVVDVIEEIEAALEKLRGK